MGMVCLHLGFCCSRWLSRGYSPDSFLPSKGIIGGRFPLCENRLQNLGIIKTYQKLLLSKLNFQEAHKSIFYKVSSGPV